MAATSGGAKGERVVHRVRVGYADTDQGGVAHHSRYLVWLEAARVEFLRARGLEYRDLEYDSHFGLPVADARVRYRRPARFDDLLDIECSVGKLGRALVRFDYRVWWAAPDASQPTAQRSGEHLLCEAEVTLACVRLPEMRVCSLPDAVREACR